MRTEFQIQQHHRRGLSISSAIASDRDDDLILFRDMRKKEQEHNLSISEESGIQPPRTPSRVSDQSLNGMPTRPIPFKSCGSDDILASDWDKSDFDWLMTPPGTPLFLNVDHDFARNGLVRTGSASIRSLLKPSKLGEPKSEIASKSEPPSKNAHRNLGLEQPLSTSSVGSASTATSSDSSSSLSLKSSTQNSNSVARPPTQSSVHMSRLKSSAANNSRVASLHTSAREAPAFRSNGGAHAMPSSVRSAIPSGRSATSSRPPTPVKRSPSPSHSCNPPTTLVRCSSANRASSGISKGATMSRATSPTSKAWSPYVFNRIPQEPLPNLRTSIQERPSSFSKGNKAEEGKCADTNVQNRKPGSALVTKEQASSTLQSGGKKLCRNGKVDVSISTSNGKVGERAVETNKPTVCSKEGQASVVDPHVKKPTKPTSLRDVKSMFSSVRESSGLGRNAPKKSLDLGSKHVDAGKGTPNKFRSFMANVAKSTLISRKSGSHGTYSASSVSGSPMATSSSASSEHNMSIVIDPESSELGDDCVSERGSRSSATSQHDLFALGREKRISSWLQSPECLDDDADIMQIFEQEGLESLSGPESPLITELEGTIECDSFHLDPV